MFFNNKKILTHNRVQFKTEHHRIGHDGYVSGQLKFKCSFILYCVTTN